MKAVKLSTTSKAHVTKSETQKAHDAIKGFHQICDLYNEGELDEPAKWKGTLKFFLQETQEAKKYIVYLFKKENCEATRAYMDFVSRVIIRLSSLIHNGRKETTTERVEHMRAVRDKYNCYPNPNEDTFSIIRRNFL